MIKDFSFWVNKLLSLSKYLFKSNLAAFMLIAYLSYHFHFAVPMIQNLETTLKSGAVPQVPQFRPSTTLNASANTQKNSSISNSSTENVVSREVNKEVKGKDEKAASPSAKPAGEPQKSSPNGVTADPLGDARNKVQDEILKEFAAIMASGTMRASEAAALATKRVMQRYGHTTAVSQN